MLEEQRVVIGRKCFCECICADAEKRGFSTRFEGRLDMRMDQTSALSAYEVVNDYSEQELISIMKLYGEVKGAHKIVAAILDHREEERIEIHNPSEIALILTGHLELEVSMLTQQIQP